MPPGRSPRGERGLKYLEDFDKIKMAYGRSPRGERGLKWCRCPPSGREPGRSPRGERGLKWQIQPAVKPWRVCRSPRGERGLKFSGVFVVLVDGHRRSPRGERGLKYCFYLLSFLYLKSLPPRGAWIEMHKLRR